MKEEGPAPERPGAVTRHSLNLEKKGLWIQGTELDIASRGMDSSQSGAVRAPVLRRGACCRGCAHPLAEPGPVGAGLRLPAQVGQRPDRTGLGRPLSDADLRKL